MYIVYTVLGDVSIYVVGKDEYDELACKYIHLGFFSYTMNLSKDRQKLSDFQSDNFTSPC